MTGREQEVGPVARGDRHRWSRWREVGGSWVAAEYGVIGEISRGSSTAADACEKDSGQGTPWSNNIGTRRERRRTLNRMLDFEQQANQTQALASLDDDWHLLEGERTTFAIFFLPFLCLPRKVYRDRQVGVTVFKI
ncbi:Uncharacterized protein DBV15_06244 [Temnothorax longispinosus]|uniref:Uncharacterized protein n=1 Tax=Temnothorax longispinosus TaxID=300112 RepID=A0A4S2L1R0_9HYME|nr:Uncharacterized protein DBV15_06244 [Temnothorax longispinosus]